MAAEQPHDEQGGTRVEAPEAPRSAAEPASQERAEEQARDERWLRALADLDNARKRSARDVSEARDAERARVAAAFLPVVDNLDLALAHAEADPGAVMEGVRAVRDQAIAILAALGFPRRDDLGAPFDPTSHEVVALVDDPDAPPGTVVQVVRPGYGEGEHQLRPVAVAVARQRD